MLAAQVLSAGGVPIIIDPVSDDVERAMQTIMDSFDQADIVIATGGVSVGDYDILVDVFEQWDGELLFNKVAMRPGSPTSVGIRRGKFLFGLSGNPGACFVSFELFVRPLLWGMQGKKTLPAGAESSPCRRGLYETGAVSTFRTWQVLYGRRATIRKAGRD